MKPVGKVKTKWTPQLAYAIGLVATDGNLSSDGRHMALVSKDIDQIQTFKDCLGLTNSVSIKKSGFTSSGTAYMIQFGDIRFYKFLLSIGLTPAKSKTMGALLIPKKYFFDFLRGVFDGDGSFYSYWDRRWKSSFLFYVTFASASLKYLEWLRETIENQIGIHGYLRKKMYGRVYQLSYAKQEAKLLIKLLYKVPDSPRLERKYKKVYTALAIDLAHTKNND